MAHTAYPNRDVSFDRAGDTASIMSKPPKPPLTATQHYGKSLRPYGKNSFDNNFDSTKFNFSALRLSPRASTVGFATIRRNEGATAHIKQPPSFM